MTGQPFASRPALFILVLVICVPVALSAQNTVALRGAEWGTDAPTGQQVERLAFLLRARSVDPRLNLSVDIANSVRLVVGQPASRDRSWVGRHPIMFGALVGFGAGFLIGYLPGDDAVLGDFTAEFNGLIIGGIGAGTGALVLGIVSRATK